MTFSVVSRVYIGHRRTIHTGVAEHYIPSQRVHYIINKEKKMSNFCLRTALLCAIILIGTNAFTSQNNAAIHRSSSSLHMTVLTANGKKIDAKEGTPLKNAVAKLGVKPKYSCKK